MEAKMTELALGASEWQAIVGCMDIHVDQVHKMFT
jgi:hypothetical protein